MRITLIKMRKLNLIYFIAPLFLQSCKKDAPDIKDTIKFQSICQRCTIEIKSTNGKFVTSTFTESSEINRKYSDIMPFTGRIILQSEQPGMFRVSASVIDSDGSVKKTVLLTDAKPNKLNSQTVFNSDLLSN